ARRSEARLLGRDAQSVLKALRAEWEMGTADLREASRVNDRARFGRAIDELQRTMKVIPGDVLYKPFTYIWTLTEARVPEEMHTKVSRQDALREIARAFLTGAGLTLRGELSKVTGLSRPDAGLGNRALVSEGFAQRPEDGVYILRTLE